MKDSDGARFPHQANGKKPLLNNENEREREGEFVKGDVQKERKYIFEIGKENQREK